MFRLVCGELLSKGRKWVVTCRITARRWIPGLENSVAWCVCVVKLTDCLGLTVLSSLVLAVLLLIGGSEKDLGPVVEVENTVRLFCAGCGRNLSRESNVNYMDVGIIILLVVEA